MRLKTYLGLLIVILGIFSYEYYAMSLNPEISVLRLLGIVIVPDAGSLFSKYLGWIGLTLIVLMDLYVVAQIFRSVSKADLLYPWWTNFYVFCGLLGLALTAYHANLNYRGPYETLFFKTLISVGSSIIQLYFYLQLLGNREDYDGAAAKWANMLKDLQMKSMPPVPEAGMERLKNKALRHVGVRPKHVRTSKKYKAGMIYALLGSLYGDFRLLSNLPKSAIGLSKQTRIVLKNYAVAERRRLFWRPFQNWAFYWHFVHLVVAFSMYREIIQHIMHSIKGG